MVGHSDWDERELDSEPADVSSLDAGGRWRSLLPWLLWALIPLALGALYLWLRRGDTEPPPRKAPAAAEVPAPAPPPPAEEPEETIDLPPLAESDPLIRDLVGRLATDPFLASLLGADDLVRKFVVSVANVAEGASPARQLAHVRPEERFEALETGGRTMMDPESFRRYDPAAAFFSSLPADSVAKLYRTLEPLFDEAHRELGLSDRKGFRDTLSIAMGVLMSAPVVEGPIPLRAVSVNYAFEDPKLESLSAPQKHLLRMGPENTRRIQRKLGEIARALGIEPRPPS